MSFADHKITEFTHRITDLPDQPTLSPQELKARFDSSPEELRQAVNSVCDEGERLSARVEGIVTDTFGDTIDREMLSHELAAELDAKAEQTALDAAVDTLKAADTAETTAREALAKTVAQKCEVYFGSYTGDGAETRTINIGFTPKAILTSSTTERDGGNEFYDGLALPGKPVKHSSDNVLAIVENGFSVCYRSYAECTNREGTKYNYIAFK